MDGEDLGYHDRAKMQMMQQKDWVEQQKREHEERKKEEDDEEMSYAHQTQETNRMRGMLEDESTMKRKAMMKAIQDENQRLAKQKRDKEIAERKGELEQDYQEISYSFVPYGAKNDLPPTFDEFSKTQGVYPVLKKK